MTIHDVKYVEHAVQILKARNIQFDTKRVNVIKERAYYTGEPKQNFGIHIYFMRGNADVAYFTPMVGTLHIQEQPREWSSYALENSKVFTGFVDVDKKIYA